jgi:hypothetical protein
MTTRNLLPVCTTTIAIQKRACVATKKRRVIVATRKDAGVEYDFRLLSSISLCSAMKCRMIVTRPHICKAPWKIIARFRLAPRMRCLGRLRRVKRIGVRRRMRIRVSNRLCPSNWRVNAKRRCNWKASCVTCAGRWRVLALFWWNIRRQGESFCPFFSFNQPGVSRIFIASLAFPVSSPPRYVTEPNNNPIGDWQGAKIHRHKGEGTFAGSKIC